MASKRNVKVRDLMGLQMISDPQISPTGDGVAFVHTTMDYDKDEYVSDIWIVNVKTGKTTKFTSGRGKDKHPRWSPNGQNLLFTSIPPGGDEDRKKSQLYVIPLEGGEAQKLTDIEGGVESPRWSPDGKRILFISPIKTDKSEEEIKVIKRIQYKFNGRGFFPGLRKHVLSVSVRGGKHRQITKGEFDVDSAEYLPNSKEVTFISNIDDDADLTRVKHIYKIDSRGGKATQLTKNKHSISSHKPSTKGDVIAYIGHDFKRGLATNQDVWLLPVEGGSSKNLIIDFDQDIGTKLSCDIRVSSPNPNPGWSADGKTLYFTSTFNGVACLHCVNIEGTEIKTLIGGINHSVEAWSIAETGTIAYTTLGTTNPIELWLKSNGESTKLTNLNKRWSDKLFLCDHERFEFKSSAGHLVEGWLMRPPQFDDEKKYPMIVEIHGGPRGAFGYSLMHEFQVLAAQGWVIMYINPYGSGGYYEDFQAGLPGHYGEQDYADIMESVDYVLKKYDFIDTERLGVTGGSYGGYMTNWIVTHTDRFKAAVTLRSISNWVSFFGTSDIGWTFGKWEMGGIPWIDEENFQAKSPIRYVQNAKTPTLIIHSEEDHRCPIEQAEQFFTALKVLNVPTEFIRFPKENHDLSRKGKPKNREQRLKHIIRWFKKYLE
jgi:dipeptidyl aminopeptidase/acylaminoacyl peptidase